MGRNIVKKSREELLMSKAELARKAGVSSLTIDRIEKGKSCRMETKRKIILALGFDISEKNKVFTEDHTKDRSQWIKRLRKIKPACCIFFRSHPNNIGICTGLQYR